MLGKEKCEARVLLKFIINLKDVHILVIGPYTCIWMSHTRSQSVMIKNIDVHLQNTLNILNYDGFVQTFTGFGRGF